MKAVKTQGVVLRYTNINESDRILTVFSPELGKIPVMSRGCRRPKSRFLASSQLFCYSEFVLTRYRDLMIMTQAEVKTAFFDIRNDLERFAYASYILNIVDEAVNPGEENYHLFALLLKTLSYLSFSDIQPEDITAVFELKLMELIGYRPELETCVLCGTLPETVVKPRYQGQTQAQSGSLFSVFHGGIVCRACATDAGRVFPFTPESLSCMKHILDMDVDGGDIRDIQFSPGIREQLHVMLPVFVSEKLDKHFKSRDYIDSLKNATTGDKNL